MRFLRVPFFAVSLVLSLGEAALADQTFSLVNASDRTIVFNENSAKCTPSIGWNSTIGQGADFSQGLLPVGASTKLTCTAASPFAGDFNAVSNSQQICSFHFDGAHVVIDYQDKSPCRVSQDAAGLDVMTVSAP
jgi:hypothetical protein